MARQCQQITWFKDDMDGSEKDVRTVKFSFEGLSYEIDLGPKNVTRLQKVLAPYVEAGTKLSNRTTAGRGATSRGQAPAAAQKSSMRAYASGLAAHGHDVKPRGRVPDNVISAYTKAGQK